MRKFLAAALTILMLQSTQAGTPQQADAIRKSYEADAKAWLIKLKLAQTTDERAALFAQKPDPLAAAQRMWVAISPNLSEPWVIAPSAWLVRQISGTMVPGPDGHQVPAMQTEIFKIRDAWAQYHMQAPDLAPACLALGAMGDGKSLEMLSKIDAGHPDKKIQGVAALAESLALKKMGDQPDVMRKRLDCLRKAIIESADVMVDNVSVAKIAEDELYMIRFLTKGRVAPELTGKNSGGLPMSLSQYQGKTVVLLFWTSATSEAETIYTMVKNLRQRYAGKPFEVVGVNLDRVDVLRALQASGTVDWPNFSDPENALGSSYRVSIWPYVYILDGSRKIQYVGPMGSFVEMTVGALMEPAH
jgi:peroxiredoxin